MARGGRPCVPTRAGRFPPLILLPLPQSGGLTHPPFSALLTLIVNDRRFRVALLGVEWHGVAAAGSVQRVHAGARALVGTVRLAACRGGPGPVAGPDDS